MDELLHHFESMVDHCLLVFTGQSSFRGFLGGAGFRPSTVASLFSPNFFKAVGPIPGFVADFCFLAKWNTPFGGCSTQYSGHKGIYLYFFGAFCLAART